VAALGVGSILAARLGRTRRDASAERVLFALAANRALDPSSKLAAAHWVGRKAWIDGLPGTSDDACYRAMDWLRRVKGPVEKEIFHQVANLLNLEVDLLFSGTTSTYFELDGEDEPLPRDKNGNVTESEEAAAERKPAPFRAYGKSKDHRDDLPQVVIGMAVTRDGIPVRVWCWPGNTADSALIRQVKDDMRDWALARVVWVADRGFSSAANRRYLRSGDHHYIVGEKLRSGSAEAGAALSRQGRYQDVAENLRVKEVGVSDSERFVICSNPEAAQRDAATRARMLAQLEEMIKDTGKLTATRRAELRGVISTKPGLNRYLRVTPGGLLRIDAARTKAEEPSSRSSTSGPSTTARKSASEPTSSCAGSPCCSSASPRPPPAPPGPRSPASWTCSPSAPSPARPARPARPPSSPRLSATSWPSSRSRTPRRSSKPARHRPP
jgi:hypothetical protein